MALKLKVDDKGAAVLKDGLPVWIDEESNAESVFDANQVHQKILDLSRENKKHRERADALEQRYKILEEIEDIESFMTDAVNALDTMENLKEKDLDKADKIEKLKAEMRSAFEENEARLRGEFEKREREWQEALDGKAGHIRKLVVSNKFATCPYFAGEAPKTMLPPDAAEALFGQAFRVEEQDGEPRVVAYHDGEPIYSRSKAGEYATFDEAIQVLVDRYPNRDRILRATGGGSGAQGGTQGAGVRRNSVQELQEVLKKPNLTPAEMIAATNALHKAQMAQTQGGAT